MPRLSEGVMRMTILDRTKQEVSDYIDEVNICVDAYHNSRIGDEIKAECKRRGIPYKSVCTREMTRGEYYTAFELVTMPYDIQKICLSQSSEVFQGCNEKVRKIYKADSRVPALKKKQLVDWVVTKYNKYCPRKNNEPHSDNYFVWIQPDDDVETWSTDTEAMDGLATDWRKKLSKNEQKTL